jgi:outer membrane protein assembly factor BamD (BamD/ComL family)
MSAEGTRGSRHWKIKKRDGSRLEPANLDVLRHWVETGQIGPDDHVIHDDLADWVLASEVVELDDLFKKKYIEPEVQSSRSPDTHSKPKEKGREVKVPDCAFHPGQTASEICVGCGKFICEECRQRSDRKVYCKRCMAEKQVGADPGAPVGPNAASAIAPGGDKPPVISGLAIASVVLAAGGILAFARMLIPKPNIIYAPAVGFVAFMAALLGGLALSRIGKNMTSLRGRGLALAGIALGTVTIAGALAVAFTMAGGAPARDATRRPDAPITRTPARRISDTSRQDMEAREAAAQRLLDQVSQLLDEEKLERAINACNQIVRLYPDTQVAKLVEERLPVLLAELEKQQNESEDVAEKAYEHAMSMYSGEDRATALELLRNLAAGYPNTEAAKKARALIEEEEKRAEAENLRKDEEEARELFARADQLLKSEQFAEAARVYRRITQRYANTSFVADATLKLEEAEVLESDPSEREFHKIQKEIETLTYDESISRIQSFLGRYPSSDRASEARELLEENAENKSTADNLYKFGRVHFEDGKYEVAIGRFGKLLQDYPRSRWIAQTRTEYEEALRRLEE